MMTTTIAAMEPPCFVYGVDFRDLEHIHEETTGQDITKSINVSLAEPPNNVRRELNADNVECDVFTPAERSYITGLLGWVMKSGPHSQLFCSIFQSALW